MTYIVITYISDYCSAVLYWFILIRSIDRTYSKCFFFSLSIKIFIAAIASTGTDNVIVLIAQLYIFGFPTFLFIVQYYT